MNQMLKNNKIFKRRYKRHNNRNRKNKNQGKAMQWLKVIKKCKVQKLLI